MLSLYVVFIPALMCRTAAWEHVIYVDSAKGNNTQECIDGSVPCMNLSFAFQPEYRRDSTRYVLLSGTHYLDNSTYSSPFTNLADFAIVGNGNNSLDTVIVCNAPNSSLAFVEVSNVYLERVTFSHCAGLRNSTSRDFTSADYTVQKTQAALYFYLCNRVSMNLVTVTNSHNATGVIMYNTIGSNTIVNSTFSNNRVGVGSPYPGGGGFYVEFSYCVPGDANCTDTAPSHVVANSDSYFHFQNCSFENNWAGNINSHSNSTFIIPYRRNHEAFGRGGGLSIYLKGNASNNTFDISDCHFENNQALWGAGFFTEFHDSTSGNKVCVNNSTFKNNNCPYTNMSGTGGGGMRLGHYVYYRGAPNVDGNKVLLQNCSFRNNSALNGGALSMSPALQNSDSNQLASVFAVSCYFENNVAELGSALYISRFSLVVEGEILPVTFSDSQFVGNSVQPSEIAIHQEGVGAVYVNAVPVQFHKKAYFERNNGSAFCIVGTQANFTSCNATFLGNVGSKGGAIALLGAASILIDDSTYMHFEDNFASLHGGAIYNKYIERENLKTYASCFIHHTNPFLDPNEWNAIFYFHNNSATLRGKSIHSTSILPCSMAGGFGVESTSSILCWRNWIYVNTSCSSEISTDTGSIEFTGSSSVKAIPGKIFHLPITIQDDLGHNINTETVFTATSRNLSAALVDPLFRYISSEAVKVNGLENSSFTLDLVNAGDRVWHVEVSISLQLCPPGFEPVDNATNSKCTCSENYAGKVICDPSTYIAYLENAYWMGTLPGHPDTLAVSLCLPGFCYTDHRKAFLPLPKSILEVDAHICGRMHRTGIFCGECERGYGPAVNSETYECVSCTNGTNIAANTTYYALSVHLPLLIFFAVIIIFNIKLTTGPANAFIVYSQVIASTFDLDADQHIPLNLITNSTDALLNAYRVPYGIFNLNFLERFIQPLCLGTNLNALDILQLDYLVAFFPLLMIIVVIVIMKVWACLCRCFRRKYRLTSLLESKLHQLKVGKSLIHAFAAFLLLSYTRFSLASSYIVNLHPLIDKNGNHIGQRRSYYAGQFTASDPKYIFRYFLPACIIFATFVAIPPLLLLEYPVKWLEWCISKFEYLRRFYPVDKVHILLDTFQGCYKNKMRFFAGLYFLFRLSINVSYILTDTWLQQFIVQQITCVIFIVLIALCQPYNEENKIFNYIDTLMFTNLALVNALSLYLYAFAQTNPGQPLPISAFVVQYVLVFLPLLYMISYLIWFLSKPACHKYQVKQFIGKLCLLCCFKTNCCNISYRNHGHQSYHNLETATDFRDTVTTTEVILDEPEDEMEAMLQRAEAINTYTPQSATATAVQVVEQRELEDSGLHCRSSKGTSSGYGTTGHSTNL